jgi:hypothetical protein
MHKYIIGTIFKHLYEKIDKKPQVFIFFDSIDEIKEFYDYFQARVPSILYLGIGFYLLRKRISKKSDCRYNCC